MKKIIRIIVLISLLLAGKSHAQVPSVVLSVGTRIESVRCPDLNNDGHPDIVGNNVFGWMIGATNDFSIIVMMNNGDGTYSSPQYLSYNPAWQTQLCNSTTHDVGAFDFDQNGLKDILVNCYYYMGIFYQTSPGVFNSVIDTVFIGTATTENFAIEPVTGKTVISQWFSSGATTFFFTIMTPNAQGGCTLSQISTPTRVQDFKIENNTIFGRTDFAILEYDMFGVLQNTYPIAAATTAYDVANNHISVATNALTLVEFSVGNTIPIKSSTIASPFVQSMKYADWDGDGVPEHIFMRNSGIEILDHAANSTALANSYSFYMHMHALNIEDLDGDGTSELIAPYFDISTLTSGIQIFGGLVVTTGIEPEPVVQEVEKLAVTVYPNPASDFLHISKNVEENTKFEVFTLTGKLALFGTGSTINVSSLNKGIYIVHIVDSKNNVSRRFTKL